MQADLRRNIEIKAKCDELHAARAKAIELGAVPNGLLEQTDIYFPAHHGRLKLRQQPGQPAQLIWYDRANNASPKKSDYQLIEITDSMPLIALLTKSLGVRGEVRKKREILIWKNVRIHLDQVERLGTFIEFEAVIDAENSEQESRGSLNFLCNALQIGANQMIGPSYSDLLGI